MNSPFALEIVMMIFIQPIWGCTVQCEFSLLYVMDVYNFRTYTPIAKDGNRFYLRRKSSLRIDVSDEAGRDSGRLLSDGRGDIWIFDKLQSVSMSNPTPLRVGEVNLAKEEVLSWGEPLSKRAVKLKDQLQVPNSVSNF